MHAYEYDSDVLPQDTYKHQRATVGVGPCLLLGLKQDLLLFTVVCSKRACPRASSHHTPSILVTYNMILSLPVHMNVPHRAKS